MGNLADMQSALVDYIDMVGYAGYAHDEAQNTISGSIATTKAAWSNLVTGVADDNADFEKLIDDFVESVGVTADKILPKVQTTLEGAGKLVEKLVPVIIKQIPDIVENTLPKMLQSGVKIIKKILEGISNNPDKIVNTIFKIGGILIKSVWDLLPNVLQAALGIGKSIVQGVWQGIQSMVSWFTSKVRGFFSGIVNSVKKTLGIHSPSRVFAAIGKNMAQGVGVGWDDEFGDIQDEINGSLDFSGGSISPSSVGGGVSGRPINITQNIYSQKKSAAQLMQEARWQAQMGVLANA